MGRHLKRRPRQRGRRPRLRVRVPLWLVAAGGGLGALALFNLSVAFFGNSHVFPLSPFFLKEKAQALSHYAKHRVRCVFTGHESLDAHVARAAKAHRLPPGLLEAVVQVESSGQVHRISKAGAMGPGQLMPGTARLLDVKDPFDPAPAVDGSARYLAAQLRRYRGDVRLALAAYNAGPGNVKDRVPQNGETEHYVRKVMRLYERTAPSHPRRPSP